MENALRHLAIVMDGLGRSETDRAEDRIAAAPRLLSQLGRKTGEAFSLLPDLVFLTFFSPELQLWARTSSFSDQLFARCRKGFEELEKASADIDADLVFLGRPEELPPPWPDLASLSAPVPGRRRRVNFFLNYSGREEIVEAARRFLESGGTDQIDESTFADLLATAGQPDPDLIIYAGGDLEPKDFLLWQASYSEIWYSPGNCLDFSREDILKAAESFAGRHRRFGKVT